MVYIDDSIMQKGCLATAGSKILENFTAPFDATVVSRLSLVPGTGETKRVRLSEFGLGEPGELPGSPLLCNDVFGFVRRRAGQQGLCYIRPTYGTVSRFGLIPVAASMDQIGLVCKDPKEGYSLLSHIAGYDENDGAMFTDRSYTYKAESKEIKWYSFRSPGGKNPLDAFMEKINAKENVSGRIDRVEAPPSSAVYDQVTQILGYAEISNNISRYDGIKFGYRTPNYRNLEELYTKSRTEGFGLEAKLAALMGYVILSKDNYEKYYDKAMKIRRLIKESLCFDKYDVVILTDDNPLAVLAGLPSLTFGYNGTGIQLAADVKKENVLLKAWELIS